MRLLLTLGFISTLSLAATIAVGDGGHQKTNYSKYASRSTKERHGSSADYSALNASKTHQKAIESELKKLENQSHNIQKSNDKNSVPKLAPLRPVKIDSRSKAAGIDVRTKPTGTKMAKNSSNSGHGRLRGSGRKR